mgnify:FL=1
MAEYRNSGCLDAAATLLDEPRGNPRGMCGADIPLARGTWNSGHREAAYASCRSERNVWQRGEIERLRAQVAALLAAGQAYRERSAHTYLCPEPCGDGVCTCGKATLDAAFDAAKGEL